jgi:hypothetical protein
MDIGNGYTLSEHRIPVGLATGIEDKEGTLLETSDKVQLSGCKSRFAYVGINERNQFVMYFGGASGPVAWNLNSEIVSRHSVKLVERG